MQGENQAPKLPILTLGCALQILKRGVTSAWVRVFWCCAPLPSSFLQLEGGHGTGFEW